MGALDAAMVIVAREPDGRWYVTFTIDTDDPEPLQETGRAAGVDLGVTDFAVTRDGERIANPRHLERKARNLARYQRRLARCRNGSANGRKAAAKVARAHRKVRDARAGLPAPRQHRAGPRERLIVIEDLAVRTWSAIGTWPARSPTAAGASSAASLSTSANGTAAPGRDRPLVPVVARPARRAGTCSRT